MQRATERQRVLSRHLQGPTDAGGAHPSLHSHPTSTWQPSAPSSDAAYERHSPSADDVVIVSACRTALCKARRGGFRDTHPSELVCAVLQDTLRRTGVEPQAVGDVCFGSVLGSASQRAKECRMAMFLAGFPVSVPVHTVNRQCCSGLQAVAQVAAAIRAGLITIGIAGGMESMSTNPMPAKNWQEPLNPRLEGNQAALDCLLPMGIAASENVAERFGVSRQEQDEFAAASHRKAAAAQAAGRFQQEVVPVQTVLSRDAQTGEERQVVIDRDDGIRPSTTPASLAQLQPAFKQGGSTTAGNSSQMSDGAAAMMLMTRSEAARRGLPILGVFRSFAAVGVPPAILGIGPTVAIPAALRMAGIGLEDVAVYEINEAFASQAAYCVRHVGIDRARVNPNGGAIALGHPLGCTGARQVVTLLHELQRRGRVARFGVVSMCIGSGMGAAAVFERGDGVDAAPCRPAASQHAGLSCDAEVA